MPGPYRRILAAIDIGRRGEAVARQAAALAREHGAALALAHVVDYGRGLDGDHVPFLTPAEMEAKLEAVVHRRLREMAVGLRAATLVGFGDDHAGLARLALGWQPDLVVVGRQAPHGLTAGQPLRARNAHAALCCEVLLLPRLGPAAGWSLESLIPGLFARLRPRS